MDPSAPSEPGLLDALSLAAEAVDELVVHTARDVHRAVADRVRSAVDATTGGTGRHPGRVHDVIAASSYAGAGLGLRAVSAGLEVAARAGLGPSLEAGPRGRLVRSAVNGLMGDRLARERPRLAIRMAVREGAEDVRPDAAGLAAAFPRATPRLAVLLHGLGENDASWSRQRAEVGTTYPETLEALGWTPVVLRYNTGLALRDNGVELAALLGRLVNQWPVPPTRLALIGHSMGGLVARAACGVRLDEARPWTALVTDLVTLGTPHTGAPAARLAERGSRAMARLPETAPWARILDRRSVGIADLRIGLGAEVPGLPQVRHRLVSATVHEEHHPVSRAVGDLLVRTGSARARRVPLPGPEVLHLSRTHHLELLNHPDVHEALRHWLG